MKFSVLFFSLFIVLPAAAAEAEPAAKALTASGSQQITVEVSDGTAVLRGRSASLDEAERHAARIEADPAVKKVVNQIIIPGAGISDKILANQAREALRNQSMIEADRVEIAVSNGRAVMMGEIGSLDEQDLARELVSRVPGIVAIENRLELMFDTIRTDAQIGRQIEFMVADDPLYEGAKISAHVTDGIVRLSGEIASRELWERLVGQSYVTGVFAVEAHEISVNRGLAGDPVAVIGP